HIKGAISIPRSQLIHRLREIPPGKLIVTYCACVREHTAALAVVDLAAHGVNNAAALAGGWNEWTAAGLPTKTGATPKQTSVNMASNRIGAMFKIDEIFA